jgi:undecaprenyl-diphosphatase
MNFYSPNLMRIALLASCVVFHTARATEPVPEPAPEPAPESGTAATAQPAMTAWQAAILGAVEGLTEYLPVSSTGHLILTQRLMGIGQTAEQKVAADAYSICIQAGAILAVLSLYFPHLRRMIRGIFGRDPEGRQLTLNVAIAFFPAAVVGLTVGDWIKDTLFGLWPIVTAWLVGGIAILVVSRFNRQRTRTAPQRDLYALSWRAALIIGLLQCVAVWPGTSRSLVTIVGGLLVGLHLHAAVVFSFLLGMITLSAATLYDALRHGAAMQAQFGLLNIGIGFAVATVSAIAAVKWMVAYLQKHGLALFGWYRIVLAIVVAVMLWNGWLTDQI